MKSKSHRYFLPSP